MAELSWAIPSALHPGAYYEIKNILARGGQGTVYLAKISTNNKIVVFKSFHDPDTHKHLDIVLLRSLRHGPIARRTIARIIELPSMHQPGVVMEYHPMGDLLEYTNLLVDQCECPDNSFVKYMAIPESLLWNILRSLIDALDYLHYGYGAVNDSDYPDYWAPIIHRDVKPENILVTEDPRNPGNLLFKLTDFDLADWYDENNPSSGSYGTPEFQPPEQWAERWGPIARPEGDIWAVGAIIHQLVHDITPRENCEYDKVVSPETMCRRDIEHLTLLRSRDRTLSIRNISPMYSETLNDFMLCALAPFEQRPTAKMFRSYLSHHDRMELLLRGEGDMVAGLHMLPNHLLDRIIIGQHDQSMSTRLPWLQPSFQATQSEVLC